MHGKTTSGSPFPPAGLFRGRAGKATPRESSRIYDAMLRLLIAPRIHRGAFSRGPRNERARGELMGEGGMGEEMK